MGDDLEAFLRQAAQRRAQKKQRAQPDIEILKPPPKSRPPVVAPSRPSQEPVLILDESNVVDRVGGSFDLDKFQRSSEELGSIVSQADEKMEARLHEQFDHELGQLEHAEAAKRAVSTGGLVAFLRSPQNLRNAIIFSEIMRRPDW
jgi:hypothetical protein